MRSTRWVAWPVLLLLGAAAAIAAPAPRVKLELQAPDAKAARGQRMALDAYALIDAGWHINGHEPIQAFLIPTELRLTLPPGVATETLYYPPPDRRRFAFAPGEELLVYEGKVGIATALLVPKDFPGSRIRIEGELRYQACNDTTCLPPNTAAAELVVPVVDAPAGQANAREDEPSAGHPAALPGSQVEGWLRERGLLFTLLATAVLGLGLNLTPCVYPLISVTIAYFGGQARARSRVLLLACVYVGGIALSFSALGVLAGLSGGLFGSALQKPAVIVFIAAVLVVLALGSFGVYQFRPPAALTRWAGQASGGLAGALFMGLTMGVVAAPCVGPVLVGLLVFIGSRQDAHLGFLLFFALALGMGAPYVALAFAAGAITRLPRSGEWLVWIERLFGCVLLALAAYFVHSLLPAPLDTYLLPAVLVGSGVFLGFFAHAGGTTSFRWVKRGAAVGFIVLAVWLARPPAPDNRIAWESIEAVSRNGRDAPGRPLLIDFVAAWCIPCVEMDRTTYVDAEVIREAERFRMVKADVTQENDETTRRVEKYQVRGVPTVILYGRDGQERQRFVGYTGPDELLAAMRQVD